MKLLLIKALPEDHLYSQFVNSLARALAELGHEAVISDQRPHVRDGAAEVAPLVQQLQAARWDAVVSLSSFFGAVTLDGGHSLFDALGVKFLGWQLDHPIYAPQSLSRAMKGRYAVYANRNHQRFAQAVKLPGRATTLLAGAEPPAQPPTPWASREWTVFVAATWNGAPQAVWEQLPDSPGRRLLMGVIERLREDREASLLDAFNETSRRLRLGARLGADPAFDDQMIGFLREPLTYFRNRDRIEILRALADSGLPLTVCGSGWREHLGERKNVVYLDRRVDFADLPALYANARIVLNLNAGNGACERAVYSASAGAAVVSDYSAELAELFRNQDERVFFNRAKPGHVVEAVGRLVEGGGAEAMAERGRARVAQCGLWRHRAQQMVEFLQAA